MIEALKYFGLLFLILFCFTETLEAQNDKHFNFLGINPSVTIEPFYEQGEFDVNILPIVYQRSVTKRFDIRLTSICNLGIRNNGNAISHFGFEAAFPIFLNKRRK